jgi:hypothetical protein
MAFLLKLTLYDTTVSNQGVMRNDLNCYNQDLEWFMSFKHAKIVKFYQIIFTDIYKIYIFRTNQPTINKNYRYCHDQLLKIGLTVSIDRQLNKLNICVHGVIYKLNISQPKTHKRSKRGGKAKILTNPSCTNLHNLKYP